MGFGKSREERALLYPSTIRVLNLTPMSFHADTSLQSTISPPRTVTAVHSLCDLHIVGGHDHRET